MRFLRGTARRVDEAGISALLKLPGGDFEADDGKVYWHIIDPADGCPADNGLVSVTIIGSKGLQCDALSTALFVMGTDKAQTYLADHTDVEAVLVTDDGRLLYTGGLRKKLDITGDMPSEVIARD